jgi:oligopeptidase B
MADSDLIPPSAPVRPRVLHSPHGERNDPYYWLRDDTRKDADMLAYLRAENAYREQRMAAAKPLEDKLYDEIVARLKQDDATVPYRKNGYWYYTRYVAGFEHPIFARRAATAAAAPASAPADAPEEILLDVNALAAAHDYYRIGALEVSPDSQWLAFCEDTVGRREFRLRFKNLRTGETLDEAIADVEADLAWANDNQTLLYVEKDPETLLGLYVKAHRLGSDPATDTLVFRQTDNTLYTSVSKSKSDRYIFISMEGTLSSEWRYADAFDPELVFKTFLPLQRDHEYQIEHLGDCFVVRTNWQAVDFRLMQVPIALAGNQDHWRDVVAHRAGTFIEDFDVFDSFIAVAVRTGGLRKISIKPWRGPGGPGGAGAGGFSPDPADVGNTGDAVDAGDDADVSPSRSGPEGAEFFLDSDEAAYTASIDVNAEIGSEVLRYSYTSLSTPVSVYDYNVRTGEKILLKRDPVVGDFDPANYTTEFLFAPARDGRQIPVSLLYAKGFVRDGSAPLLQYGYGAYGLSMDPSFSSARLSLIDRGFIYAIAHVRGGQELGRHWYDDGRLLHKRNSFTDFIDVTRFLVAQKYAAPGKVCAMGGSAGGLLMGAVANLAPEHYRAIVAQVPFVDVLTTMLDETVPLTTNEYDEWGNPHDRAAYEYLLSYSPYDNVRAQEYPAMLVTTGLWDSQVQYYEPAKWVAKLRALKTDRHPLLLYVDMEAGHGGKAGRFQRYREIAMEYAFLLDQLGAAP